MLLAIPRRRRRHLRQQSPCSLKWALVFNQRKPQQKCSLEARRILLIKQLKSIKLARFIQTKSKQLLPERFEVRKARRWLLDGIAIKRSDLDDIFESVKLNPIILNISLLLHWHSLKDLVEDNQSKPMLVLELKDSGSPELRVRLFLPWQSRAQSLQTTLPILPQSSIFLSCGTSPWSAPSHTYTSAEQNPTCNLTDSFLFLWVSALRPWSTPNTFSDLLAMIPSLFSISVPLSCLSVRTKPEILHVYTDQDRS